MDAAQDDVWHYRAATESDAARRVTAALLEACRITPHHKVLDLACGGGNPSVQIATHLVTRGTVFAVDDDAAALRKIPRVTDAAGRRNLFVCCAPAEHLPFPDTAFDAVTCRFGIMFFHHTDCAISELRRVLRPKGHAAFAAFAERAHNPLYRSIETAFADVHVDASQCSAQLFRYSDAEELTAVLRRNGLEAIERRDIPIAFGGTLPEVLLRHILRTTYAAALASLIGAAQVTFAQSLRRRLSECSSGGAEMARYRVVAARRCPGDHA